MEKCILNIDSIEDEEESIKNKKRLSSLEDVNENEENDVVQNCRIKLITLKKGAVTTKQDNLKSFELILVQHNTLLIFKSVIT